MTEQTGDRTPCGLPRGRHGTGRPASLLFPLPLGGDAKLLVLLCVSPGRKHVAETLQSLAFGARARQVKRGPARRKAPGVPVRKEPCAGGHAVEPHFSS